MSSFKLIFNYIKLFMFFVLLYAILGNVLKFVYELETYWVVLILLLLVFIVYVGINPLLNIVNNVTGNKRLNSLLVIITNAFFSFGILSIVWYKIIHNQNEKLFFGGTIITILYLAVTGIITVSSLRKREK